VRASARSPASPRMSFNYFGIREEEVREIMAAIGTAPSRDGGARHKMLDQVHPGAHWQAKGASPLNAVRAPKELQGRRIIHADARRTHPWKRAGPQAYREGASSARPRAPAPVRIDYGDQQHRPQARFGDASFSFGTVAKIYGQQACRTIRFRVSIQGYEGHR